MKINKLMLAMLAGAMFVSCSDDRNAPTPPAGNEVGSEGYIGISIGMPAQGMSRGANDNFEDGLASEYGVRNAVLIFFTGPEADAKFYKAYSIGAGEWNAVGDNPNQITQNRIVTFPVNFATETKEDLWVLAVINPGSVLSVGTGNTLTVGGDPFTGTIKDFMILETSANLTGTNNFFMTNAPYSSVPGTITDLSKAPKNGKFRVLSPVNKDRICATAEAARNLPAAAIFVERAVAKVEVNADDLSVADGAINFPEGDFDITSVDWVLDNTEPTTYIIRNLDNNHDNTKTPYWAYFDTNTKLTTLTHHYRFLGNAGFGHTMWPNTPDPDEHYRTYFGVDPHGNGIDNGNLVSASVNGFTNTGSQYPQYCYENTFDVQHMDYRNTTRAVIKVNYGSTGNLYTVGEDKKNVYVFETAASYLTFAVLNDINVVAVWTDYFKSQDKTYNNEATTGDLTYDRAQRTATNDWMTVQMRANEETGRLVISSIVLKDGEGNTIHLSDEQKDKLAESITNINASVPVKFYKDGVAYYSVRIRHFGNDLAPWTPANETTNTTEDSYGKIVDNIGDQDIQNYLGRYGVLRNNWYVLNLGTINQMGEPIIGDLPLDGTPDDRVLKEESISCRINILSWAKRNQTDDL